jgi:glutamine cyclotransferase
MQHVRADEALELQGRGLGADARRHADHHERRHRALRFLDPATLKETGRITVRDAAVRSSAERARIREGEIFANVWQTERIARISPKDGRVTGWIDLAGLLRRPSAPAPTC